MKQITVTGKTVEVAVEAGAKELGVKVSEVTYEVIEEAKKGFLGFGATPAKVTVTYVEPVGASAEKTAPVTVKPTVAEPAPIATEEKASAPTVTATPVAEKPTERSAEVSAEKSAEEVAPAPVAPAKQAKQNPSQPKPKRPQQPKQKAEPKEPKPELTPEEKLARAEQKAENRKMAEATAVKFIGTLLDNMNVTAEVTVGVDDAGDTLITVTGEAAGDLIGHHGETLDALQYLVNLAANRKEIDDDGERHGHGYTKITLDIENYRVKREETLRSLARKRAAQALKYHKPISFEPMTPYERRIIHSEIQGIEGVCTNSVGTDNNRKVVIYPLDENGNPIETAPTQEKSERGNRRGGKNGGRGKRPPYYEKPRNTATAEATENTEEATAVDGEEAVAVTPAPQKSRYNGGRGGDRGRRYDRDRKPRAPRTYEVEDDSDPTPVDPSQVNDLITGVTPAPTPKPLPPTILSGPKSRSAYKAKSSTVQRPYQKPVKKASVESYYFDLENSDTGLRRDKEEVTDIAKICGIYEDTPDTKDGNENK